MLLKPRLHWLAALTLLAFFQTATAEAQKRVALVIGNSAYQATPALTNPKNDAADFVALLKADALRGDRGARSHQGDDGPQDRASSRGAQRAPTSASSSMRATACRSAARTI